MASVEFCPKPRARCRCVRVVTRRRENPGRDKDGNIYGDPDRFPSGMAELASWLHDRGFKFGLYLSLGWDTCSQGNRSSPIPGSFNYYSVWHVTGYV